MALVPRTLTPRALAANRGNALKSTGPRTGRGKSNSRLNNLRNGRYSAIRKGYFHFWLRLVLADPRARGYLWDMSKLPIPMSPEPGFSKFRRDARREYLSTVARYLRPRPVISLKSLAADRSGRAEGGGRIRGIPPLIFEGRSHDVVENKGAAQKTNRKTNLKIRRK
jgi:hypothetical protein